MHFEYIFRTDIRIIGRRGKWWTSLQRFSNILPKLILIRAIRHLTSFWRCLRVWRREKHVTSRIITKEDVKNVLVAIQTAYENNEIEQHHYLHYKAIVLFSAFTGQRQEATVARLTIGQFRMQSTNENLYLTFCRHKTKFACSTTALYILKSLTLYNRFKITRKTMNRCSGNCLSRGGYERAVSHLHTETNGLYRGTCGNSVSNKRHIAVGSVK